MKEKYDSSYKVLQKKEKELDSLIETSTATDSNSLKLSDDLAKTNSILGLSKVQGEGIIIKISDGKAPSNALDISNYIVHDETLRMIVNYLFNSGAEAVSINGQRVVETTAITCVGTTIKVNNEKVTTPFEIKAIGKQSRLYEGMTLQGYYLYNLKKQGVNVESVEKVDNITIEAYDGIYKFEYAKKVQE